MELAISQYIPEITNIHNVLDVFAILQVLFVLGFRYEKSKIFINKIIK